MPENLTQSTPIQTTPPAPSKNSVAIIFLILLILSFAANLFLIFQVIYLNAKLALQSKDAQITQLAKTVLEEISDSTSTNTSPSEETNSVANPTETYTPESKMLKWENDYFSFFYPPGITITDEGASTLELQQIGPSQQEGTEFYDGLNVHMRVREISELTAQTMAMNKISEINQEDIGSVESGLTEITIGGKTAYTFVEKSLGTFKWYYFDLPNKLILEVTDGSISANPADDFEGKALAIIESLEFK